MIAILSHGQCGLHDVRVVGPLDSVILLLFLFFAVVFGFSFVVLFWVVVFLLVVWIGEPVWKHVSVSLHSLTELSRKRHLLPCCVTALKQWCTLLLYCSEHFCFMVFS